MAILVADHSRPVSIRRKASRKSIRPLLRLLLTALLVGLGCTAIFVNWPRHLIDSGGYTFSGEEARRLAGYPAAQYAHGLHAWMELQPETAARFFRRAVSGQVLFLDAWLKLAETEAAMDRKELAKTLLTFTLARTDAVFRWKWPQMVLAGELGMQSDLIRLANDLLSAELLVQDTLQLLHAHLDGDVSAVIAALEPHHLTDYLDWLTRWGMADDSLVVWQALTAAAPPDEKTARRYAHFLLTHKRIDASLNIWRIATGTTGLTNPGFESEITGQGFDWRYWGEKEGDWELKRIRLESAEGDYGLRIQFNGRENIAFQNLFQIVPVTPDARYRLTYTWKTRGITTDQGPFIEIYGYDRQGLYRKGPMMTATHDWQTGSVEFVAPGDCRAAVVRLRRLPSMRFDSKIRGKLWLDDFRLEKIETNRRSGPEML